MRFFQVIFFLSQGLLLWGQGAYTSYLTGNSNDLVTTPSGGVCLMGGASESDDAMRWFLQRSGGGDILVLRASGSNGYNNYFYSQLGVTVNSVESIVFNNATAAQSTYIHEKIMKAEAIWFAGGDQWKYVSYWRNSPIDSLINDAIQNRHIVVGGTSAGMAILGKYYFSAQNGSVTSTTTLNNPYNSSVKVDSLNFLKIRYLEKVITDTHFDNPDRRGRLVGFLARIMTDWGKTPQAIASEEYTAVCVDTAGLARVFGNYPADPDYAWFVQTNCDLTDPSPEICNIGVPLHWDRNATALRVYQVPGTVNGAYTFNLKDWKSGNGGNWKNWYVLNGLLQETPGNPVSCTVTSLNEPDTATSVRIYPNPNTNALLQVEYPDLQPHTLVLTNIQGKTIQEIRQPQPFMTRIALNEYPAGVYILQLLTPTRTLSYKVVVY
jgi:cyanophycinase-like exopeptidase